MKVFRLTILAVFVVFGLQALWAPPAAAEPFIATPLLTGFVEGQHFLECRSVNISTKSVTVTAQLIDSSGEVVNTATCPIAPGAEGCIAFASCGTPGFSCRGYCRFTGANKSKIRGSIIRSTNGDATVALPAD